MWIGLLLVPNYYIYIYIIYYLLYILYILYIYYIYYILYIWTIDEYTREKKIFALKLKRVSGFDVL